jgi:hypothetical protein
VAVEHKGKKFNDQQNGKYPTDRLADNPKLLIRGGPDIVKCSQPQQASNRPEDQIPEKHPVPQEKTANEEFNSRENATGQGYCLKDW